MSTLRRCARVRALLALSVLVLAAACAARPSAQRPAPALAFTDRADALACSRDVLYPLGFSSEGERGGTVGGYGSRLRDDSVAIVAVRRDASGPSAPQRDELSVVAGPAGDGSVALYATAITVVGRTVTPLSAQAGRALHLLVQRCGAIRRQGLGG